MTQLPNLIQGPEPVETAVLHFKLYCKLKIFETESEYEGGPCCLLAVSQYYGLIFVGNCKGFSIIQTKALSPTIDLESFPKKDVILNWKPTHISVDHTQKILAVVCHSELGSMLIFYNIQSFASKDVAPLKVTLLSKLLQTPSAQVVDLTWQPVPDGSLMFCFSDGSVLALSQGAKDGPVFNLPNTTQATCFCWSPKGKQIVVGNATGTLSQYKPDLKVVKTLPPLPLFNGNAMVVSVLWISSFQFAVAYNDRAFPESFPVITIVNAAKNEPVNVINYDDITYSSTLFRNHQIYMTHQSAWNLIFVSSANSIEIAVLHSKDSSSWEQWLLSDDSRAELPLNPDRQETFPLGWGFDFTSQEAIPWGEGTLPPMPRLLLISDEGLLCVFNVVNAAEGAPQLCAPPKENFDESLFVVSNKAVAPPPPASEQSTLAPAAKSLLETPTIFGTSKPTFSFQSSPGFGGFGLSQPQTAVSQSSPLISQQLSKPAIQTQLQKQQPQPTSTQPQSAIQIQLGSNTFQQQPQTTIQIQPQLQPPQSQATIQPQIQPQATSTQILQQVPQGVQIQSQISFSQSSSTFKLSTPQFGAPASFSFGNTSTPLLGTKTVTSGNENAAKTNTTPISLTIKPSSGQTDLFAAKNLPQTISTKQSEITVEKTTSVKPEEVVEAVAKPDLAVQGDSPGPETPELAAVDDSVYLNALQEEIDHFTSELRQLSAKFGNLDVNIGSEEIKTNMKNSIESLNDFWKDLKETTEEQKAEFHAVVMDLMEAFAWLEDAKSRNLQRKNPSYIELKKSEELDPFNAKHMNEIRHLKYYIENQLKQLSSYLEKEWMDHQEDYRNEVKSKMAVPPLEEVYKTMHYQLKILHKQKTLVQELKERVNAKKRKNKSQSFITSSEISVPVKNDKNRASELSKLAENLLQLKINQEDNSPHSTTWEMMKSQLNAISERSKKLTREKQAALRDALSECDTVRIRPVKTTLESSAFLRSLALEKMAAKASKVKSVTKEVQPPVAKVVDTPPKKLEDKPVINIEIGFDKTEKKPTAKVEIPKMSQEKLVGNPLKVEEKSPLASLSGIVSSIGKTNEVKPPTTFVFGSSTFQKPEPAKDVITFGSVKLDQKSEEPKTTPTFTFGLSKPAESIFGKKDTPIFGGKPAFTLTNSTPITTKPEVTKTIPTPNVTITLVTSAPATTTSSPFTFTAVTSTPVSLPKLNLFFSGKEQTSTFGTPTTGSLFSKPAAETEVVKNDKPDEPVKKPEAPSEKPKETPSIFGTPPAPAKTVSEVAASSAPPNVVVTTPLTVTTTPIFAKFIPATTASAVTTETKAVVSETTTTTVTTTISTTTTAAAATTTIATTTATATTASVFSFSTALSSFAQSTTSATASTTTTTTTTTTTASLFGTPTTTSVFEQVSSTTPTNIFGGGTQTPPTSSIFGGSTPTKTIFGQAATPTTTAESIFGGATQTTTTTPTSFGQKPDSVAQTANLFGQLLSDGNRSVFGNSTQSPTTTASIFSTPKNFFGGGGTTTTSTASLFGGGGNATTPTTSLFGSGATTTTPTTSLFGTGGATTTTPTTSLFGGGTTTTTTTPTTSLFGGGTTSSSVFPQTTVFGQPTTASSIFGQTQTSTPSSFFGQNICSVFGGGGASATTNQTTFDSGGFNKSIFGQSTFGQTTNNTSIFGGSSSIFGGTSSTTSSNVFQTPKTSTTFGSSTPGPFSSGTSTFGESSFGTTSPSFQKPLGGFGSPPAFGGQPAFGGSPTFGGSPSFGSLPAFGSMSQGTFGQSAGSTAFENFANQNTVGFGNLAQQSQSQGFGGGFGSSSFENKPAFGGNSFSSWRSK